MCIRDSRKTARELEKEVAYESNPLNQDTEIAWEGEDFKMCIRDR